MKSVILAEKPNVAKELARVLNCNKKAKGYFEGEKYVVTWALGHLVTLAEPENYDIKYKEWRMEDLPMLPEKMKLKVIRKTSFQYNTVNSILKRKDISEMIIATDAGREGELVARWIMKLSSWRKPVKRLWISSQTDAAIKEGFASLKPGKSFENLYKAAVCRAEADWLIGLNVTRALTCKFNAQLTAGRVQTPTLSMIINRENEIRNFRPKDYWTIHADFGGYQGIWREPKGNEKLFDYARVKQIVQKIKDAEGSIREITVSNKSEYAPLLYDLTELQRDANKRYSFSAKKTLSVLQGLYENRKLVTYPRTDSRYITSDMLETIPQRLKSIAVYPYTDVVRQILQKPIPSHDRFANNSKVTDHHAIIPTEQPLNLSILTLDEKKLYELILKRFLIVFFPPFRYEQITIKTIVEGELFFTRGKTVKDKGWKMIHAKLGGKEEAEKDLVLDKTLKQLKKGDQKKVQGNRVDKLKTKPPDRHTEATLLTAMESPGKYIEDEVLRESIKQGGLGTPATRAEIIEKLFFNDYIERDGREIYPTPKGFQLIDLVPETLKSPELTAQWEFRLSRIGQGKENDITFISDIRDNTVELVKTVNSNTAKYKADNLTQTKCPMCGKYMLLVKGKRGRMLACSDRECGHREPEKKKEGGGFSSSKGEQRRNRALVDRFSDNKKSIYTPSIGDLFETVVKKK
jgi:DNA topoisomerase-3